MAAWSSAVHNSNETEKSLDALIQADSKTGKRTVHRNRISNDDEVFFMICDFITARRMECRRICATEVLSLLIEK